ncbi:MAG: methyltransferase domain-containing protein [Rhodospirillaceae bacterium]|nr:methyltransferase domain-containing protein [Rhodospirillaceae bacterium]
MTAEHPCPVCGDARHLAAAPGADLHICATCGAAHVYTPRDQAQTRAPVPTDVLDMILSRTPAGSILDVRCGDGASLAAAMTRGWRCFGVEPSAELRAAAKKRLSGAFIVESIGEVIPHHFDVVLLPHILSDLPSPYPALYQLFSIGAIAAKTTVVITTAAGLVRYTPPALEYLLKRLHFAAPDIRESNNGLVAIAHGSDFTEFMRERYVPGTWSKLAEYEHLPRYAMAKTLAAGKTVLDFGCGTGYGAAIMADVAANVTGLDIDAAALAWAEKSHHNSRLAFRRHDDLGASLPEKSFDLITCFEMIEHVEHATQKAAVASMARLLRDDGVLVISTPNPDVTALYGANPYHIREMTEAEFRELLAPHFPHIEILRQYVRVGIAIDHDGGGNAMTPGNLGEGPGAKPLAFLAVCSRAALPVLPNRVLFDQEVDFIAQFMQKEETINRTRMEAYRQSEDVHSLHGQLDQTVQSLRASQEDTARVAAALHAKGEELKLKGEELKLKGEELDTLRRVRDDELSSPRFLARRLWHASRARLKAKLSGK